jgi:hypothetical protein
LNFSQLEGCISVSTPLITTSPYENWIAGCLRADRGLQTCYIVRWWNFEVFGLLFNLNTRQTTLSVAHASHIAKQQDQ